MCWVVWWEVQGFEVVLVVFDFWIFGQFIFEVVEDFGDVFQGMGDWMQVIMFVVVFWQGDVDCFGGQVCVQCSVFQYGFVFVQCGGQCVVGMVDCFIGGFVFVGGQCVELFELGGDVVVFVEQCYVQGFQCVWVLGSSYVGQCLGGQGLDVIYGQLEFCVGMLL